MHKRFINFFLNLLIRLSLKYPYVCLIVSIIITIFSLFAISRLSLDSSLTNLLPDTYESVRNAKEILKETGGTDQFIILLQTKNFDSLIEFATLLKQKLFLHSEINHVYFEQDMEFFYQNALLYMKIDELETLYSQTKRHISQEKVRKSPFYFNVKEKTDHKKDDTFSRLDEFLEKVELTREKKYYYNPETNTLAIRVIPYGSANNINEARNLYYLITKSIDLSNPKEFDPDIKFSIGGSYKNKIDEYETIIKDIKSTSIIVAISIILLLTLYFKNIFAIFFITLPLFMSIAWTFAIAQLTIGKLNTFTGFLFIILFGLGVDFGIHLFARYIETRNRLFTVALSIKTMFKSSGKSSMTSAITTALVFFSLTLTNFKGFSEFGFIAGTGVIMAMLSYFFVLPCLLIIGKNINLVDFVKYKKRTFGHRIFRNIPFPKKSSAIFFIIIFIISLASTYGVFKLEFDYDFKELRANLYESDIVKENIGKIFKDSFSPAVFISTTIEDVDKLQKYFEHKINTDLETPSIEKIRTIRDIVPPDQEEKKILISKIKLLLENNIIPHLKKKGSSESKENLKKIYSFMKYFNVKSDISLADVPLKHKNIFLNISSTKYLSYIFPSLQLRDGRNAIMFSEDVTNIPIDDNIISGGGSFIVFADMLQVMIKNGKVAILLSLISVFLVLFLDFRKIERVLIVSSPLLISLFWLTLVMFMFNVKFNFFNIIVIPSIIGIGIDNGIHLYHRFLDERGKNLKGIFINTGGAVIMTSITTIIGFSGLALAKHGGLNSIGKFAVLGISLCLLTTLLIMPNLFNLIRRDE